MLTQSHLRIKARSMCLTVLAFFSITALADEKIPLSFSPQSTLEKESLAACGRDQTDTFLFVNVVDLRSDEGNIRVHIYPNKPEEFLKSGKGFKVDVPTKKKENMICLAIPDAGDYAVTVMHDKNANGKADVFSEGFGFSNNPKLGLSKPKYEKVVMTIPRGVTAINVKMNYIFGSDKKKVDRRRRLRRH
ncbi:DUF2141 domain-containing protein [Temperatibacter marinus]|uniref:DUF2141 domain-containing protein n=1 Tax=Temperatibacter marinus TaxID=1456591 RepID=A0AA52EBY6_9PROT|nr:DUF2141 domain-containing protein [Temperatibacter marinus]WND01905.1 DUF2141 domain-containing protein [Temperatibacter marinus]